MTTAALVWPSDSDVSRHAAIDLLSVSLNKNNMKLWNFINSYIENISLLQVSVWNNNKTCTSFWNTNEKQKLDLVLGGGLIVLLRPRGQIRRCIACVNYSFEVESKGKKVPGYHQSLNWNRSPTGRAISVRPTRETSAISWARLVTTASRVGANPRPTRNTVENS